MLIALAARAAKVTSEIMACTIEGTFRRALKTGVSVGLKAVLVLKATNK